MYRVSPQRKSKKPALAILGLLLLCCLILAVLELTQTTHFFHHTNTTASTGGQYTKGIKEDSSSTDGNVASTNSTTSSNTQPGDSKHQTTDSANQALIAPTGTFANVYTASTNEQMGSTCNTTPGATCQIIFTMGLTVKSLPMQTADKGGAAYWSWKPKDIGLTSGTWHITAKAVLGNQSKETSNDPLTLRVN